MVINEDILPEESTQSYTTTQHYFRALDDLESVRARGSQGDYIGIYASADALFKNAIFGRDSIEVAEDVLAIKPEIVREVILSLVRLQGIKTDPSTDEEPGKIHHEYRTLYINGEKVSEESQKIIQDLAKKGWGTEEEIHYFGTADATPLFVKLVSDYVSRAGPDKLDLEFLDTEVMHKSGQPVTVRESVMAAVAWIEKKMADSPLHVVEFKSSNPLGIENQTWKDSSTSFVHYFGELANHRAPIAAIELVGYARDALVGASSILGTAEDKQRWQELANSLQESLHQFWIPDEQFFAMGIDRDENNEPRLIQTLSTNPALLLNTGIFDNMPEPRKQMYIAGIVNKIMGREFISEVGIRTRALRYANIIPHPSDPSKHLSDYHGSETSWIKETYDIAKGLRRQGFNRLAMQLEIRIVNAYIRSGKFYEFYYVDDQGRVNYHPKHDPSLASDTKTLFGTNIPEGKQAWTIADVLASLHNLIRFQDQQLDTSTWQYQLEDEILQTMEVETVLTEVDAKAMESKFRVELLN